MSKHFWLSLFFFFLIINIGFSQNANNDTLCYKPFTKNYWNFNDWLPTNAPGIKEGVVKLKINNNWSFYLAISLLLLFGILKMVFPQYAQSILKMFTQSSIKAPQIRDQLKTNALASLLFNLFFCIVLGCLAYIFITNKAAISSYQKVEILTACIFLIIIIYVVKYLSLTFLGWIFQFKEPMSNYIFTTFFFNKVIGILVLPIVIFMLISHKYENVLFNIALIILFVILLYRYFISYITIAKPTQLNKFHFFLYLCAVEIAPLLLLYKVMLINFEKLV